MSRHHQMMLQRYGLGRVGDMYSQVVFDPVFGMIFTSIFSQIGITGSVFGVSAASIAGAISTGGGWTVLKMDGAKR